jgi:pSer/pThr/pTyr-binding forkhead associated (FHA) protein
MSTHRLGNRPAPEPVASSTTPIPGPSLKDRIKQINRKKGSDAPTEQQDTKPADEPSQAPEAAKEPSPAKPAAEAPAQPAAGARSPITDDVTGKKPSEEDEANVLEADPLTEQDMQDIKDQTGGGRPRPSDQEDGTAQQPWQIIFQPTKSKGKAIALEVQNITIVGRADPDCATQPDLDLTPQGGDKLGVSRQHAILMSNADGLWLIDLDSTNGTWVNGLYLQPGLKYRLRNGDRIEFGSLELAVRVLGALPTLHPDERAGRGATRISRTKPRRY